MKNSSNTIIRHGSRRGNRATRGLLRRLGRLAAHHAGDAEEWATDERRADRWALLVERRQAGCQAAVAAD